MKSQNLRIQKFVLGITEEPVVFYKHRSEGLGESAINVLLIELSPNLNFDFVENLTTDLFAVLKMSK